MSTTDEILKNMAEIQKMNEQDKAIQEEMRAKRKREKENETLEQRIERKKKATRVGFPEQ